jgi:hypothetical protein
MNSISLRNQHLVPWEEQHAAWEQHRSTVQEHRSAMVDVLLQQHELKRNEQITKAKKTAVLALSHMVSRVHFGSWLATRQKVLTLSVWKIQVHQQIRSEDLMNRAFRNMMQSHLKVAMYSWKHGIRHSRHVLAAMRTAVMRVRYRQMSLSLSLWRSKAHYTSLHHQTLQADARVNQVKLEKSAGVLKH